VLILITKEAESIDIDKLARAVHIDTFRENKYVNKTREIPPDDKGNAFIRKGVIGDWKNYFTVAMNEDWDTWIAETLDGSGFEMVFE
jgi:hypothetical protein